MNSRTGKSQKKKDIRGKGETWEATKRREEEFELGLGSTLEPMILQR